MRRVIHIDLIKLVSVNQKYLLSRGRFVLSPPYRQLKKALSSSIHHVDIDPPYRVIVDITTYLDIDNALKCIIDSIEPILTNDRDINELHVYKTPVKRGRMGRLSVYVETIEEGDDGTNRESRGIIDYARSARVQ